jgi:hypothetical protein
MNAAQILGALVKHGARVAVDGDRVRVLHPNGKKPPADLLADARAHKAELRSIVGKAFREEFAKPTAPVEHRANAPEDWAEGFARLNVTRPSRGFTHAEWEQLLDDGGRFLEDGWATKAAEAGWSILDVFGVHPIAPNARYDAMGLIPLLRGGAIVDIRSDRAAIKSTSGNNTTFYLRRESAERVALWDLAADPQREDTRPPPPNQRDTPLSLDTSELGPC